MRDGQAGLGHPPWRGGGGGDVARLAACLQGRVEGVLKGSEWMPRRILTATSSNMYQG